MSTTDDGLGVGRYDCATARNLDDEFSTGSFCRLQDIDLLIARLRVVSGYDEHALDALERVLERRTIRNLGNSRPGVGSQDFFRLLRITHDAERILPERLELLDRSPTRVSGCTDYRNHFMSLRFSLSVFN